MKKSALAVMTLVFILSACSEQEKANVLTVTSEQAREEQVVINDITYKV
jgi:protein involved in sex pheromone biosynthesis